MTLTPFFSLSPLNPNVLTYDAAQPNAPWGNCLLWSWGVFSKYSIPYSLENQYSNDELILSGDPVDPTERTIISVTDIYRHCGLKIRFVGNNVSTENQYLLLFSLRSISGNPSVQFFVGTELVLAEKVSGEERVAILLDVPGDGINNYVYLRLASSSSSAAFGFKGMDCYLL